MKKFYAALVVAVMFMIPASAEEVCYTTSNPEATIPGAGPNFGGDLYADNDLCQLDCGYSFWIYEEFNGIAGLQRGDEVVNDVKDCLGEVDSDYIVF